MYVDKTRAQQRVGLVDLLVDLAIVIVSYMDDFVASYHDAPVPQDPVTPVAISNDHSSVYLDRFRHSYSSFARRQECLAKYRLWFGSHSNLCLDGGPT